MFRSPLPVVLLSLLLLPACSSFSSIPVDRQPDASLLLPCERPMRPADNPTDTDVALAWIDAVQKYLNCEARHAALASFVKGGK